MTTPLQQAAQAMIDRWESVRYSNMITPQVIESQAVELRKALDAELDQSVEPMAWIEFDKQTDDFDPLSLTTNSQRFACDGFEWAPLYLHPHQPQATTPALRECWYESNELKVCRKCGQMHDKAIAAQGETP